MYSFAHALVASALLWGISIPARADSLGEKGEDKPFFLQTFMDDHEWFFFGPTLRGVLSEGHGTNAKIGFEAGLSLPVFYGIDIGSGVGSLFADHRDAEWDVRVRIFLGMWQQGFYVGGARVPSMTNADYGILGWQGSSIFAEVDLRKGSNTALAAIPQFGLRTRI